MEAHADGAIDGIKVDMDGNLWCGWGWSGAPGATSSDLDGVMVFNPQGKAIGHIRLPEGPGLGVTPDESRLGAPVASYS